MWRLRTVIQTEVIIEPDTIENSNCIFRLFEMNESNTLDCNSIPKNIRYLDIIYKNKTENIFDAFAILYEELNVFIDRIALITYGQTLYTNILSIGPNRVVVNETFEIAFPHFSKIRKTKNLNINSLRIEDELTFENQRLLRLFRNGINTNSTEEKFINYYTALEEIARIESDEMIINTCGECGNKVNTGRKATNNFIKSILTSHAVEPKVIKMAGELRNKIAHGGAKKNIQFLADLQLATSYFEEVTILEIERITGIKITNRLNAHIVDIPIVKHECILRLDKVFDVISSSLTIPVRFVNLKSIDNIDDQSVQVGLPTDPNGRPFIDPFAWPEID
jgi:hypothetical protein